MGKTRLGKDVVEKVQEHITDDVYGAYSPREYLASGDFLESVISTNPEIAGNEVSITIKHDPQLMNMQDPWYHQSVIDGRDSRESLPEIIHEGKTYNLWRHDPSTHAYLQPRPYMKNTEEELKDTRKHVKDMVRYLRAMGLDAREG